MFYLIICSVTQKYLVYSGGEFIQQSRWRQVNESFESFRQPIHP